MRTRAALHSLLVSAISSGKVYYQPPETLKMEYPCIRYTKKAPNVKNADNAKYSIINQYEITIISKTPDDPSIDAILAMPMSRFDRHYISDGLNHDVISLFY